MRTQVARIDERLNEIESATLAYKRQFSAYEYLWTTDLQAMFREFLKYVRFLGIFPLNIGGLCTGCFRSPDELTNRMCLVSYRVRQQEFARSTGR